jgi:DNA repair protein RadA/Sms
LAVLSRNAGFALAQHDVFVNVGGGVRVDEPAADLAVALALASAARGVALGPTCAFGEIALTGRLRPVAQPERRLGEAARLGLRRAVTPPGTPAGSLAVEHAATVREAIVLCVGEPERSRSRGGERPLQVVPDVVDVLEAD